MVNSVINSVHNNRVPESHYCPFLINISLVIQLLHKILSKLLLYNIFSLLQFTTIIGQQTFISMPVQVQILILTSVHLQVKCIMAKLFYTGIVHNFDTGNIDGFDAQLAIHQNFPFQLYSKYRFSKRLSVNISNQTSE